MKVSLNATNVLSNLRYLKEGITVGSADSAFVISAVGFKRLSL